VNIVKTFITYERKHKTEIPDKFKEYDTRSFEDVVEIFIKEFSMPGDKILDVFAGLGTTLILAEKLGRIAYGVEILKDKYQYILSKIERKENIIHGDARRLLEYDFPRIDLVYTSPIFMIKYETKDPLNNFEREGNYTKYLKDLKKIFTDLKQFLKLESHVIVEIANLKRNGITTLAWDVGKTLSEVFYFEGEIILSYEGPRDKESFGYDHSYCLVFSNK
jgi:hypothetical protein